jgi:hypothetical protein
MKEFYIVDDYTSCGIWDEVNHTHASGLLKGDWRLRGIQHPLASDGLYQKAGIQKPSYSQLPMIACVTEAGIEQQFNVTAQGAADFIRARI